MQKFFIVIIFLLALIPQAKAQDVYDSMASEWCNCLEKNFDSANNETLKKCWETVFIDHVKSIVAKTKHKTMNEIDMDELMTIMQGKMGDCKYVYDYNDSVEGSKIDFVPDAKPDCKDIHTGDYFYVLPDDDNLDTTYVTFTADEYFERMHNGKTYSRLALQWTMPCHFQIKFIESNDVLKNAMSKKGALYDYDIVKVTDNYFIVKCLYTGPDYYLKFTKMEKPK